MNDETPGTAAGGEVAVYEDAGGEVRVDVRLERETVWLTQRQMAEVFDGTPENVLMHLRNIFASGELESEATTKEFLAVRTEGRPQGPAPAEALQSRRHHLGRLPRQHQARRAVPPMGHPHPARSPGARLHRQRAPAGRARPAGSAGDPRPAGADALLDVARLGPVFRPLSGRCAAVRPRMRARSRRRSAEGRSGPYESACRMQRVMPA